MKIKSQKYEYTNVMLIDDDELANFINQKMLESVNFSKNIYVNTSAKSALEFIANVENLKESGKAMLPEVIFIDLNMPLMDGFQFIEVLKEKHQEIIKKSKLIVLTSSLFEQDHVKAKEILPSIMFYTKPLSADMLKSLMQD
ncbi:MAG: response regulator [Bacteroidia bacterium]